MSQQSAFVNLDRRFSVLHGSPREQEETARQSYLFGATHGVEDLDWPALLASRLVIVLGEPGSGKSCEFRQRATATNRQPEETFFLELEQLVAQPLEETLSTEDRARLQTCVRRKQAIRFFLDSVDEAKLRRTSDFYRALDRIKEGLGRAATDRAAFVISSRISEWQPVTDRREVLSRLGHSAKFRTANDAGSDSDGDKSSLLVVQLKPLDQQQVLKFVSGRGISDAQEFVAALDLHHAWEFARRPIDVIGLSDFWQERGRLGTLTELIEYDITCKLRETSQRQTSFPLSEERAREGAEVLAAATVLCREIQFKVPDDAFVGTGALDAGRCLPPDWKPAEWAALLSRPLFDSATYGRIRFHHRRVAEYLASEWLRHRVTAGCPMRTLLQLLFDGVSGETIARPSLIPVTAWLCAGHERWNCDVRAAVLQAAPEIHLEYGDAEALPIEYRRNVLRQWIHRNAGRDEVWVQSSSEALQRLATEDLASEISELLMRPDTSVDIQAILTRLVRAGRLQECIPSLLALLSAETSDNDLQTYVLAAFRDMGTPDDLKRAWETLRSRDNVPDDVCGVACEAFYPRIIGPRELVQMFQRTQRGPDGSVRLSWTVERHLQEHLECECAGELLAELNRLLQEPPLVLFAEKETCISDRYLWVLNVVPIVLLRLFQKQSLTDSERQAAVETIILLRESQRFPDWRSSQVGEIHQASLGHPAVRQLLFWRSLQCWRSEGAHGRAWMWRLFDDDAVMRADKSDVNWLIEIIADAGADCIDRRDCLAVALQLGAAHRGGSCRQLRHAIGDDATLAQFLNEAIAQRRWGWIRRLRARWTNADMWQRWWRKVKGRVARRRDRWREHDFVRRQCEKLQSGKSVALLSRLCNRARGHEMQFGVVDWSRLKKEYGSRIASAVKSGCKCHFRNVTPPLPHEKPDPNRVEAGVIVGLVGARATLEDDDRAFHSMSDEDVRRAARYALREMNGFPDWFPELARLRSGPVAEVLQQSVRGEWEYHSERSNAFTVLADLASDGGQISELVRSTVMELFTDHNPPSPQILELALVVLLKTSAVPNADIGALAFRRCQVEDSISAESFILWLCVCLQYDADAGVGILRDRVNEAKAAADVMLRICNVLNGEVRSRLPVISNADFLRPAALRQLIPIVYRHISPIEDIDRRRSGPYTPTARDHAAEFRSGLLVRLSQSDSPEAARMLRELRDVPELAAHRDWILHLIEQRTAKDADLPLWGPDDLRAFASDCEIDPRNDAELFRIIVNRLLDIKDDVERSDNSLREEVSSGCDEYTLRRWLARKLNERSRQRYTIPQESEIDQQQRPDLRAENPKTAPVSIEVKWGDNWTISELKAGLQEQLIGQYLRAHSSRYGVYLVGFDERDKRSWRNAGQPLDFRGVIELLQAHARDLAAASAAFDDVRVIGIDFRTQPELGRFRSAQVF